MANAITAFNPEFWGAEMQPVFYKENVAIAVASTELRSVLTIGDTAHKPYRSALKDQAYTKGTDITVQDVTATDEYLTVDTARIVPFYVDDLDKIQNKWNAASEWAQDGMRRLNNVLDRAVLNEYSNAFRYMDAGDVGGSAGSNIAVAGTGTVNVHKLFARAKTKLNMVDVPMNNIYSIISPNTLEQLALYASTKDTTFGDMVGANGLVDRRFGFEIRVSNNLPYSASLALANQVTANDTVIINGVVFTFVASPTTAGHVHIGSDAAGSQANLIAAINGASGAGTDYIELDVADREIMINSGIVATASSTSVALTGYGDISVSETLTHASNIWSAQTQHSLFGVKGAIDLVTQKVPSVEFRTAEKRLGRYVYPWMLYGKKTFTMNKRKLVDVRIDASGF